MAVKKQAPEQRKRVAGESGNRLEGVKNVVRDRQGKLIAQPSDVRYARDEVGRADEIAREQGEI